MSKIKKIALTGLMTIVGMSLNHHKYIRVYRYYCWEKFNRRWLCDYWTY
ncbi:hypothetical protein MX850_01725 [Erysipelothrix sp. Poltava]|nr:hypothetical protein MX850_01725 [Erysipelothrix sp. Poltava]